MGLELGPYEGGAFEVAVEEIFDHCMPFRGAIIRSRGGEVERGCEEGTGSGLVRGK